jgi:hypothetical protein
VSRHASLGGTLALLAALAVALIVSGDGRDRAAATSGTPAAPVTSLHPEELARLAVAHTPGVARRVEAIRGLRFERLPRPRLSDSDDLRQLVERELSRPRAARDLHADEAALRLLGMIEPEDDLGAIAGDFTALAAAYYDPRKGRLFVLSDAVPAGPAVVEFVLAHELTHALEDQRFGLPSGSAGNDERVLAESALTEGTATALMSEYAVRHLSALDLAAEAAGIEESDVGLPGFLDAQVNFSYFGGQAFVEDLVRRTGDWRVVDNALAERPPSTSEQILHPVKYLLDEPPLPVPGPRDPGRGWERVDADVVGEFMTAQLLRVGDEPVPASITAGWGGDRYELWRRTGTDEYAVGIAWRWDSTRDAEEFRSSLDGYLESGLDGDAEGDGLWALREGFAAVAGSGNEVRLAVAPGAAAARRMVAAD